MQKRSKKSKSTPSMPAKGNEEENKQVENKGGKWVVKTNSWSGRKRKKHPKTKNKSYMTL